MNFRNLFLSPVFITFNVKNDNSSLFSLRCDNKVSRCVIDIFHQNLLEKRKRIAPMFQNCVTNPATFPRRKCDVFLAMNAMKNLTRPKKRKFEEKRLSRRKLVTFGSSNTHFGRQLTEFLQRVPRAPWNACAKRLKMLKEN